LIRKNMQINKMFGNLMIDKDLSNYQELDYNTCTFSESIMKTLS